MKLNDYHIFYLQYRKIINSNKITAILPHIYFMYFLLHHRHHQTNPLRFLPVKVVSSFCLRLFLIFFKVNLSITLGLVSCNAIIPKIK